MNVVCELLSGDALGAQQEMPPPCTLPTMNVILRIIWEKCSLFTDTVCVFLC